MCKQMRMEGYSGRLAPVANFFQSLGTILFEEADSVARMLELVNVSPNLGPPGFLMHGRFPASGATGVEPARGWYRVLAIGRQLEENAAHLFHLLVFAQDMF